MKGDEVKKLTNNPYLNLYCIDATTKSGKNMDYYFASRNDEAQIKHKTHSMEPEGLAIYALLEDEPDKIVLLRQYRYPINDYVYEIPAGLIEKNETAEVAAIREMKEETGLDLKVYDGGKSYYRRPFYLAQGITDESGVIVFGTVKGDICVDNQEDSEKIEVLVADKDKVRDILSSERVSVRAAYLLIQFLQSDSKEPFAFLNI